MNQHNTGSTGNAPGKPAGTARKSANKSARTKAREFAVQALYQHLVGRNEPGSIDEFTRGLSGFSKADSAHFDALLHGGIRDAEAFDQLLIPRLDRKLEEISPIEHVVMWIGLFELQHCPDVPYKVIINECIELAKAFGGTDGHKYVNGVLHKLAPILREAEVRGAPSAP